MAYREWDFECKTCGKMFVAHNDDCDCPHCGQEYNAFGQRLRNDWRDNPSNWDEGIGDLEGYEIEMARKEANDG
jgi:hypothetical protein